MRTVKRIVALMLMFCLVFNTCITSVEAASLSKPVIKKVTAKAYNSLQVQWKKVKNASGYVVYRKNGNAEYKKIATVSGANKCSFTDKKVTTGIKYTYTIKAYRKEGTRTIWSKYSKGVSGTPKLTKPVITSIETDANGKVQIVWKKVSGATGYVLYRATSKNGTYEKIKMIKGKISYTDSKLRGATTYYYKIKAYRTIKNKNYYSDYSKVKEMKISEGSKSIEITSIRLDADKTIEVNQSISLSVSIIPNNATDKTIIWSSSNANVATVKEGKVTGVAVGEAVITAKTNNGKKASCTITVGMKELDTFDDFAKAASELIKDNKTVMGSSIEAEDKFFAKRLIVKSAGQELDFSENKAIAVIKGVDNIYLVQFATSSDTQEAMSEISNWENVIYVEPDLSNEVSEEEANATNSSKSWGVERIGADKYAARVSEATKSEIKVAVVDSGVSKHIFLGNRITSDGYDFVDNDSNPADLRGHGTHVSGTIVDCTPNVNVKIMPVRVLDATGNGYTSIVGMGIRYAADHGAKIINLSLGGNHSNYIDENIEYAISKGVTVVVAAGNDYGDIDNLNKCPAHISETICVGAIDTNEKKANFSNIGSSVDVVAPGVGIVSCVPGGSYESWQGTSMATPHVTALVAMIKLMNPSYTPTQIEQTIKKNTRDLGSNGWDKYYGYGIPDFSSLSVVLPTKITLNKTSATIEEGSNELLTATVLPSNTTDKAVEWSSSNTNVAVVDNGTVMGKAAGTATITAKTSNGKVATCIVTVKSAIIVPTEILLNKTKVTIEEGEKVVLTATVLPSNATDKTVIWNSSDKNIATVDNGTIIGKAAGTATITVTTYNGKSATCQIIVEPVITSKNLTLNYEEITLYANETESISLFPLGDASKIEVNVGSSVQAGINVNFNYRSLPDLQLKAYQDGKQISASKLVWSRKNNYGYGIVNEQGFVTGGNSAGGFTAMSVSPVIKEQVITANLKSDTSVTTSVLIHYVCDPKVTFEIEDTSIATVDEKGIVYGKKVGSTTLIMKENLSGKITKHPIIVGTTVKEVEELIIGDGEYRGASLEICMPVNMTKQLSAYITPNDATDKTILWSSSNESVATIDSKGVLSGKATGTTTITASVSNGKTATCVVQVLEKNQYELLYNLAAELVYKSDGKFYSIDCKGGPGFATISRDKKFYLKIRLDSEICIGSALEVAVTDGNATSGEYDTSTITWSTDVLREKGYCYYPVSSELYFREGEIRVYYKITLANGQIIHPRNWGTTDAFFLNLTKG